MQEKMSFVDQVRTLPRNFWFANSMESLERLAFFGARAVAPLYLVASESENGLGLSYTQKGLIFSIWAFLQCIIPMVSGGYTDRYGYKKSLGVAFTINIIGYLLMAWSKPIADHLLGYGWTGANFWVFLVAACIVGTGTAIFKPPIAATVARATNETTASVGWGIFYWVVNVGGALAPMGAAVLRQEMDWSLVFYAGAIVTACNFLPMLLFYKEPEKIASADPEAANRSPVGVFVHSIATIFHDLRLVLFLGIFSCFYLMFMQLWDLLPNFINEWVNTADVAGFFGWFSSGWVTAAGQTKPEIIINIDALAILALMFPIAWLTGKISKVAAMIVGMSIALVGFIGAGATSVGWLCCMMVFVFAIGEMTCSPTFNAYIGLIAPPDKKALYMGYSNIPFAVGWAAGNSVSGVAYQALSSKYDLTRRFLVDHLGVDKALAFNKEQLPNDQALEKLAGLLNHGHGATTQEATRVLWNTYHPYVIWFYLGIVGLVGILGMVVFYLVTRSTIGGGADTTEPELDTGPAADKAAEG